MGDLQQLVRFPNAQGQFRLNIQNRCTGLLIDLGVVKYNMPHLPFSVNTGVFEWFPAAWEDPKPMLQLTAVFENQGLVLSLRSNDWLQTISLRPEFTLQVQPNRWDILFKSDLIRFADVTATPDDLLIRELELKLKIDHLDPIESSLNIKTAQFSIGEYSVGQSSLQVLADSEETGQILWTAEGQSDAVTFGDWRLGNAILRGELYVGDTTAALDILDSAVQSCGGFATAKSHEFKIQSAYNSLINTGLNASLSLQGDLHGSKPLAQWNSKTKVQMNPQIDFNTGQIHLARSIEIQHESDIPFNRVGKKQRDQAMASGFFSELELMGRYQAKWTKNALMLHNHWSQLARQHSRGDDSTAAVWAQGLKTALTDWEQALYLREFALSQAVEPTPRVNFEGLQGVRIDAQGGVRKLLVVP
ncbi:hypothetical protein [Limnobacter sp.]|uniref:hypothetical protein n=1 Tax=Limnobacter sp. TaxID=2003368 RepID=UPI0035180784